MSVEYAGRSRKYIYGATPESGVGEFFSLPVFTCAGLMWMASAVDFVMIFVSLELVTISFYILVSTTPGVIPARSRPGREKYLILGALSTGFLVYGITWIFGITGSTQSGPHRRRRGHDARPANSSPLRRRARPRRAQGFKIAAVPRFQILGARCLPGSDGHTHHQRALSVGSKAAGFIVLLRVLNAFRHFPPISDKIVLATVILAALTLIYGNLAAMPQNNLKRLLSLSIIAQAGDLLVAVSGEGSENPRPALAVLFYTRRLPPPLTLLSFLVMIVVANHSGGDDIAHFNGLRKRSPQLAFAMLAAMISLAWRSIHRRLRRQIPRLPGRRPATPVSPHRHRHRDQASGLVFYYYLKVVRAMLLEPTPPRAPRQSPSPRSRNTPSPSSPS